ncbi:unnamed protein product, partial [Owenia fusiformis]
CNGKNHFSGARKCLGLESGKSSSRPSSQTERHKGRRKGGRRRTVHQISDDSSSCSEKEFFINTINIRDDANNKQSDIPQSDNPHSDIIQSDTDNPHSDIQSDNPHGRIQAIIMPDSDVPDNDSVPDMMQAIIILIVMFMIVIQFQI